MSDLVVYWYFRFPKWVWTIIIMAIIVLIHILIGSYFPDIFLRESEQGNFVTKIISFYAILFIGALILSVLVFAVVSIYLAIYENLPDDPRKKKEEHDEPDETLRVKN